MDLLPEPGGVEGTVEFKTSSFYYGVYTPNDNIDGQPNVFEDKESALKLAKKNKKSRFKAFQFYHEAAEFSLNGYEYPNNNTTVNGILFEKKDNVTVGEKASPFRGPRPQELTELRRAIESGNINVVKFAIWDNPRLLVSSGDTPSILQEGARLNALHVAARMRSTAMTEIILNTVTDPEFIKRLYGDDNQQNAVERCKILLDLYLNTPNKGFHETPLHIASKWGAVEVLEILVSYPECNLDLKNKYGKTAEELICERLEGRCDNNVKEDIKRKIAMLLSGSYYVPVLRTEDNTLPPVIGEPFSPTTPPLLNKDPLRPRMEIHAFAGPMDKKGADKFRKIWKTPPRSNFSSPGLKSPINHEMVSLKVKDLNKGLERIGKQIAQDLNIAWKEYWYFLDSFVDIASEEGLTLLEKYLSVKQDELHESLKLSPVTSKTEILVSPISNLCAAFSACKLNDSSDILDESSKKMDFDPLFYVDKASHVFSTRILNNISFALCCKEEEYDNALKTLETDIKQLELLMNSYMSDHRFSNSINFQKIHPRVGDQVGHKLYLNVKDTDGSILVYKIEDIAESVVKMLDCFSSDDEGQCHGQVMENKPTTYRRQLICLLSSITSVLSQYLSQNNNEQEENNIKHIWDHLEECSCIYHTKKPKKNTLSRSNSCKNQSRNMPKNDLQIVSKKLFFTEDELDINNDNNGFYLNENFDPESSEEEFYTAPNSPSMLTECNSDSEDDFNDTELPTQELYLEGDYPTQTDCAVYNALRSAQCDIDKKKYPNTYRWHHHINLFSDSERLSWPNPRNSKSPTHLSLVKSPDSSKSIPNTSTPTKPSWLRVTGANSPRAAFNRHESH
ncbi:ankyrin repeat and LEM domain-containing protein 2 isoform X1 [Cylas formicarius]|uniref:ankyrin repeat and LEM domain-containing protein 2 isoform X1 n=1 Tax=Cylas formicarius TaxID=197179 RepID=UPI0029589597|nr:ankyrin repeat and LEM domain-containing protein 2 isoform X1 [Cylas formicarius]